MAGRGGEARVVLTVVSEGKSREEVLDEIHFVLRGAAICSVAPPLRAASFPRHALAPGNRWVNFCYGITAPAFWRNALPGEVHARHRCWLLAECGKRRRSYEEIAGEFRDVFVLTRRLTVDPISGAGRRVSGELLLHGGSLEVWRSGYELALRQAGAGHVSSGREEIERGAGTSRPAPQTDAEWRQWFHGSWMPPKERAAALRLVRTNLDAPLLGRILEARAEHGDRWLGFVFPDVRNRMRRVLVEGGCSKPWLNLDALAANLLEAAGDAPDARGGEASSPEKAS